MSLWYSLVLFSLAPFVYLGMSLVSTYCPAYEVGYLKGWGLPRPLQCCKLWASFSEWS